ncbi:MAG: hypothetical protein H0T89_03400 [Deltaproteobacteria bacterium]|nr:hypothetical protein [Deltaproteobacteria bacterium]MDQ3299750.1 hypothetical protein [Myxococcota bacterium]
MLTLGDIPEIVDDLGSGMLLWPEAYPLLASLIAEHEVEVVMLRLPVVWREPFATSLRASFALPRDDDPPARRVIAERVRAWLATTST